MRFDNPQVVGPGGAIITGRVLLAEGTASNSTSLDFSIDGYPLYEVYINGIIPETADSDLALRFSEDEGTSYFAGASDYQHAKWRFEPASGGANERDTADSFILLTSVSAAHGVDEDADMGGVWGRVLIASADDDIAWTRISSMCHWTIDTVDSRIETIICGGSVNAAGTGGGALVNSIRFMMNTGNLISGSIRVYGLPG